MALESKTMAPGLSNTALRWMMHQAKMTCGVPIRFMQGDWTSKPETVVFHDSFRIHDLSAGFFGFNPGVIGSIPVDRRFADDVEVHSSFGPLRSFGATGNPTDIVPERNPLTPIDGLGQNVFLGGFGAGLPGRFTNDDDAWIQHRGQ